MKESALNARGTRIAIHVRQQVRLTRLCLGLACILVYTFVHLGMLVYILSNTTGLLFAVLAL
jgi:hypothetical protein